MRVTAPQRLWTWLPVLVLRKRFVQVSRSIAAVAVPVFIVGGPVVMSAGGIFSIATAVLDASPRMRQAGDFTFVISLLWFVMSIVCAHLLLRNTDR
jgi:hypothetical protein